jgi:asparagine synthase (glutamine-hydrolysing)
MLRFDGAPVRRRDLEAQSRQLARRGPDRDDLWLDGTVGLGHRLNRTNREDAFDAQPTRHGAAVLSADLRLDNRETLATELGIAEDTLAGMADSALLLRAYLRWGEVFVEKLVGDFAFAIWDGQRLLLGRDHIGQRHVFYYAGSSFFAFASEPRALRALPEVPGSLSEPAIERILASDREDMRGATWFEGIVGLEAGATLSVTPAGATTLRRYWEPRAAPEHLGKDDAYYVRTYREILGEAVACRVRRTTAPAGMFLGAGFDSGAIAGLAGSAVTTQDRKLIGVCSAMPEGDTTTPRNARVWAERLARTLPHLDLRFLTREGTDIFTGMEASFLSVDILRGPERFANEAMMDLLAAAGVRVFMDGFGGDYTLNPRARRAPLRLLLRGKLGAFAREMRGYRKSSGVGYARLLLREVLMPLLPAAVGEPIARWRYGLAMFGPADPLTPRLHRRRRHHAQRFEDRSAAHAYILRKMQSWPSIGYALPAAARGMELTQPYHDKRVIEFALAIPERLVFRGGRDRWLARQALADVLPPEYQTRGNINDDAVPDFCEMIARAEPRILADIERMEKDARLRRYFDFARMKRMIGGKDGWRGGRSEQAIQRAARAFQHARQIEWLLRDNRFEAQEPSGK